MAAICAGCRATIAKGAKFRIVQTQVFHEQCVSLIGQSVLAAKSAEAANLRVALAHERSDGAEARVKAQTLERELSYERERNRTLEREVQTWKKISAERSIALESLGSERRRALRERDDAIARGNEARQELALQRAIATPAQSTQAAAPATEKPADDRNATEVRFSLIEPHET